MNASDVERVRNFSRAVAVEIGAMEDSLLNRGRPFGSARVLNAIGLGHENLSGLCAFLQLNAGRASELLSGLEAEGLIETTPNPDDRHSRLMRLTPKGEDEFNIYEKLFDERAAAILARHKHARRMLDAM